MLDSTQPADHSLMRYYRNGQTITSSSSDTAAIYARAAQDAASAAAAADSAFGQLTPEPDACCTVQLVGPDKIELILTGPHEAETTVIGMTDMENYLGHNL